LATGSRKLDGKQVVVEGSMERRAGVEIPQRWNVTVSGLNAASD